MTKFCLFVLLLCFVSVTTGSGLVETCHCEEEEPLGQYCLHWHCDDSTSSTGSCVEGSQSVKLEDGTTKILSELHIGDRVEAVTPDGKVVFSPIIGWYDYAPKKLLRYLEVGYYTDDGSKQGFINLTPEHLVFVSSDSTVDITLGPHAQFASKIQPGMSLWLRGNDKLIPVKVSTVTEVSSTGAYAPATEVGTIVVNDVVVSCFANVNHELSRYSLEPLKYGWKLYSWWHSGDAKDTTSTQSSGVHWYARALVRIFLKTGLAEKLLPSSAFNH